MSNELISVIIPSIREDYIFESIDSVLMQTYENIELIVVCDCPEQVNGSRIRSYLTKNARNNLKWLVIEHNQNEGTIRTLNEGIKASAGSIIYNLADDDVFADPDVLKDWTIFFNDSGSLWSTGKREIYDVDLKTYLATKPTDEETQDLKTKTTNELFEQIAGENFIFGSCTARKRECYELYGLYDERYRIIEDHSKNLSLLRQGVKIGFFDRTVVCCRDNGISSVGKVNKAYMKDSNRIFRHEVLPYNKHPLKSIINYLRWRWHIYKDQHITKGLNK